MVAEVAPAALDALAAFLYGIDAVSKLLVSLDRRRGLGGPNDDELR